MAVWHITSCLWTVVSKSIYDRFQDTTATFEVNVTAYDLENSFIFDKEAKIQATCTSNLCVNIS